MSANGHNPFFTPIGSLEDAHALIQSEPYVFVYIGSPHCGVCHALKPQLAARLAEHQQQVHFIELDASALPEVASQFHALTLPVLLLFIHAKERLRAARFVNTAAFKDDFERAINADWSAFN
ncbi:MAG: thioredoxin family protein [Neisseriaceae bacterium]|nr:thioredoxin family protein [Neisseriaceae bacterium]MBP6861685.1 thioredoxin family protein [Neisseriaceae bacterium]